MLFRRKRSTKTRLLLVLVFLLLLVFYILYTTGFFRTISPTTNGELIHSFSVAGAEDFELVDNLLFISSTDRAGLRDGRTKNGNLFVMELEKGIQDPILLTPSLSFEFYPHGISVVRDSSGDYWIFVINHVKNVHSIELFLYADNKLEHIESLQDVSMISPNDIVAIDTERFYFTNDHGKTGKWNRFKEDYLGDGKASVIYYDGESYRSVAHNLSYANGIMFDSSRNLMYVANTRGFDISVFTMHDNGDLDPIDKIKCKTGVDNILLDNEGQLWVGCHPNLLRFQSYAAGKKAIAPSEVIQINYKGENDYEQKIEFLDNGERLSGSSVAIPYGDVIFVGSVMDNKLIVLGNQ